MESLKQLFSKQKELLTHYTLMEDLPPYPVDIQTKTGQKLIKDFIRRMTEELSEAYEEVLQAYVGADSNNLVSARIHQRNYNEEIADVLHFLLEIFIYSGIEEEELNSIYKERFKEAGLTNLYKEDDLLGSLLKIAGFFNQKQGSEVDPRTEFTLIRKEEVEIKYPGLLRISVNSIKLHAMFLWSIVHDLCGAANLLKNREWTQSERVVNETQYAHRLADAFLMVMQYLKFADFTEAGIVEIYNNKNKINLHRIKAGY